MSVVTSDNGQSLPTGGAPSGSSASHALFVYDSEAELAEVVVAHLADSLDAGGAAVMLATASHRPLIEIGLRRIGIDLEATRLLSLDVAEALSVAMAGQVPVPARIRWLLAGLVEHAPPGDGPVACYAEPMVRLWHKADLPTVLALEEQCDELAASVPALDLLCGYPAAAFATAKDPGALAAVEDLHARVVESAGRPHPKRALLERVREANDELADELREAQSRKRALRNKNRNLRQQVQELRRRLEARENGDDTAAG